MIHYQHRFPALTSTKAGAKDPVGKMQEEVDEVKDAVSEYNALIKFKGALESAVFDGRLCLDSTLDAVYGVLETCLDTAKEHILEEAVDVSHATETMFRRFNPDEVQDEFDKVYEKNKRRGYYRETLES